MFHRKKRGGLVTELALRVGATLAVLGSAISMKASQDMAALPQHDARGNVAVLVVPGDLYLPFANAHGALYVGLAMATAGVLARLLGYLKLYGKEAS